MDKLFDALSRTKSEIIDGFPTGNLWVGMTPEELDAIKQALIELQAIKEAKPSEALKYVNGKIADLEDDLQHYTMVDKDKCREFFIKEDLKQFTNIKQALLKAQEQEKENQEYKSLIEEYGLKPHQVREAFLMFKMFEHEPYYNYKNAWKIVKEKCLYNDNLNYVAVCINYDMYKKQMSKKYDTKVVKTDWNDKVLLDCLKLLTEEEFKLVKEMIK